MKRLAIDGEAEVQAVTNGNKVVIREPVIWPSRNWEFVKLVRNPSEHKTDESGVSHCVRMTGVYAAFSDGISANHIVARCPYQPGEILCLSQEWRNVVGTTDTYLDGEIIDCSEPHIGYEFKTGGYYFPDGWEPIEDEFHLSNIVPLIKKRKWQKARFMPKKIAQIFLRVTDVSVSRLQSLTKQDLLDEGMTSMAAWCGDMEIALLEFKKIWERNNPIFPWSQNSWVFVTRFERISAEEALTVKETKDNSDLFNS